MESSSRSRMAVPVAPRPPQPLGPTASRTSPHGSAGGATAQPQVPTWLDEHIDEPLMMQLSLWHGSHAGNLGSCSYLVMNFLRVQSG